MQSAIQRADTGDHADADITPSTQERAETKAIPKEERNLKITREGVTDNLFPTIAKATASDADLTKAYHEMALPVKLSDIKKSPVLFADVCTDRPPIARHDFTLNF